MKGYCIFKQKDGTEKKLYLPLALQAQRLGLGKILKEEKKEKMAKAPVNKSIKNLNNK